MKGEKVLVEAYLTDYSTVDENLVWLSINGMVVPALKDSVIHLETGDFPKVMKAITDMIE